MNIDNIGFLSMVSICFRLKKVITGEKYILKDINI